MAQGRRALIASFKHRFIFIKTRKTAGTSIEFCLSQHCGPADIIAPIGPREDIDRAATVGVVPINFAKDHEIEKRYRRSVLRGRRKLLRRMWTEMSVDGIKSTSDVACTSHASAAEIRNWVGDETWENSFRFSAERHPYEKAVSFAYFNFKGDGSFDEHLETIVRSHADAYSGYPQYTINGDVVVHDFIKYETLQSDIDRICTRLKLPSLPLPHRRSHSRADKRSAVEILSKSQQQFIYEKCAAEFELFGWLRYD